MYFRIISSMFLINPSLWFFFLITYLSDLGIWICRPHKMTWKDFYLLYLWQSLWKTDIASTSNIWKDSHAIWDWRSFFFLVLRLLVTHSFSLITIKYSDLSLSILLTPPSTNLAFLILSSVCLLSILFVSLPIFIISFFMF